MPAYLASLAVGRDEGGVGCGGGLRAIRKHALIHSKGVLWLPAAIASTDDCVVCAHLRLCALHSPNDSFTSQSYMNSYNLPQYESVCLERFL